MSLKGRVAKDRQYPQIKLFHNCSNTVYVSERPISFFVLSIPTAFRCVPVQRKIIYIENRRKIRLIESNAQCYLKNLTCKGTLWQVFTWWCSNFIGSESGQKHSVHLLHNMVSNTTQHHPHPLPATYCLFMLYVDFGKGRRSGGSEPERRLEGQ